MSTFNFNLDLGIAGADDLATTDVIWTSFFQEDGEKGEKEQLASTHFSDDNISDLFSNSPSHSPTPSHSPARIAMVETPVGEVAEVTPQPTREPAQAQKKGTKRPKSSEHCLKKKRQKSVKLCVSPVCNLYMGCRALQCKCGSPQPYKNPKSSRQPKMCTGSGNGKVVCWKCKHSFGTKKYHCDCGATNAWDKSWEKSTSKSIMRIQV